MPQKEITCYCEHKISVEVPESVNLAANPGISVEILEGTFLSFTCDKCGKNMIKKLGRFGYFLACSGFPECRGTKSIPLADCPRPGCTGQIISRKKQGGKGKEFYGCTNYPECDFISHSRPTSKKCTECGYFMVEKYDKSRGTYYSCTNHECKNSSEAEETK